MRNLWSATDTFCNHLKLSHSDNDQLCSIAKHLFCVDWNSQYDISPRRDAAACVSSRRDTTFGQARHFVAGPEQLANLYCRSETEASLVCRIPQRGREGVDVNLSSQGIKGASAHSSMPAACFYFSSVSSRHSTRYR